MRQLGIDPTSGSSRPPGPPCLLIHPPISLIQWIETGLHSCKEKGTDYSCWPDAEQKLAFGHLIPRWQAIGNASLDAPYGFKQYAHLVSGDVGHSIRCVSSPAPCGVSQSAVGGGFSSHEDAGSAVVVDAGIAHNLRVVLKSVAPARTTTTVVIELRDSSRRTMDGAPHSPLWTGRVHLTGTTPWRTYTMPLTVMHTSLNATLSVTSSNETKSDPPIEWWLGAVSLQPADAWRGLRRDVIAALNRTGLKGILRYPGGCFSPFYRWRIGLLHPDVRPPIPTPPKYCAAVAGGVNAYTDGMLENGIGTDDYLALCEALGMVPAITLRLQFGTEEELDEAAAWVEYVNGDANTTAGGRLRASRGRDAPYAVRHWYLGNEISQQLRYASYPTNRRSTPPPTASEYAAMLLKLVPRLEAASPHVMLRLLASSTAAENWNRPWVHAVGAHIFAASLHSGYFNEPPRPFTPAGVSACAVRPRGEWMASVRAFKIQLDKLANESGAASIAVSADEWGLGPPWSVGFAPWKRNYSVVHAMYAAGLLGASLRASTRVLARTNYFEAINEGAVIVGPFTSTLSPVGHAMAFYGAHSGGARLDVPDAVGELDVVATVSASTQTITLTIAHLNASGWRAASLSVQLVPAHTGASGRPVARMPTAASVVTLRASGYDQASTFTREDAKRLVVGGRVSVVVPPFSVVQLLLS